MKKSCTMRDHQKSSAFTTTTDQWSSTSSSGSPPPKCPAAAGTSRMWSGNGIILDPLAESGDESSVHLRPGKKLLPSKYKGVVPQPNDRWGSQIYVKHRRIWLGTFADEETAARFFDIAAQRFRGWETYTNFKPLNSSTRDGASEMEFLRSHSEAEIIELIRKQTYDEELHRSRTISSSSSSSIINSSTTNTARNIHVQQARIPLFSKVVMPSDVGKLNRLVIPRQEAERHFPLLGEESQGCVLLNFLDENQKMWRFRYSYWKSSRSYVLSRGWTWFVKEKGLKAGDVVCFEGSAGPDKQMYIRLVRSEGDSSGSGGGGEDDGDQSRDPVLLRLFGVDLHL